MCIKKNETHPIGMPTEQASNKIAPVIKTCKGIFFSRLLNIEHWVWLPPIWKWPRDRSYTVYEEEKTWEKKETHRWWMTFVNGHKYIIGEWNWQFFSLLFLFRNVIGKAFNDYGNFNHHIQLLIAISAVICMNWTSRKSLSYGDNDIHVTVLFQDYNDDNKNIFLMSFHEMRKNNTGRVSEREREKIHFVSIEHSCRQNVKM